MPDKTYLAKVYDLKGDDVREYYDDWADSYETEIARNAYATPERCAEALAATDLPKDARILDFACGTGLSGAALAEVGFTNIDGMDISEGMLAKARAKSVYRNLLHVPADAPPPINHGAYEAIAAIGAVGPGAAPADVIGPLVGALPHGGYFVMSLNDIALQHPDFTAALDAESDRLRQISKVRGPHLPGIDVMSTVYVYQRT